MQQLHLSQFLLTTAGVVAGFIALPSPLLDASRDTIVEPVSKQSLHQKLEAKSRPSRSEGSSQHEEKTHAYAAFVSMPYHFVATEIGSRAPSKQFHEDLFLSLIEQETAPRGITKPLSSEIAIDESLQEKVVEEKAPTIGSASRIVVPSIGIDIDVRTGTYDAASGSWQVDDSSAFYAGTTVPVNDSNGTTLIYGHAKWGIFGTLPDVQPGAEVTVYTAEGIRFVYTFELIKQVDPSDVSMLTVEGKPKLLLQTCSGLFDQHRTLALFTLKEVVRG